MSKTIHSKERVADPLVVIYATRYLEVRGLTMEIIAGQNRTLGRVGGRCNSRTNVFEAQKQQFRQD